MLSKVIICWLIATVFAHGIPSIHRDKRAIADKRDNDAYDIIFENLPRDEFDYINYHLQLLEKAKGNGTNCDQCKNRIKFAQNLIETDPDHEHLVSLLLYKDCLLTPYTKSSCKFKEVFTSTQSKNFERFNQNYDSGIGNSDMINVYDNDFLHFLKEFNTTNEKDLEYYCHNKGGACKEPNATEIVDSFKLDQWWPAKQSKHYFEPTYNNTERERFNVIHMSDFHLEIRYEVGTEGQCNSNTCGLPESVANTLPGDDYNFTTYYAGQNPNAKAFEFSFYPDAHYDTAGNYIKGDYYDFPKYRGWNYNYAPATVFGVYSGDAPEVLINSSLVNMAKLHKEKNFELALFTGDLVDHDTIQCTPEFVKKEETRCFELMKHYLNNLTVLPSMGNHDAFPYAQLAPLKYDYNNTYSWNDDDMINLWINNQWFPERDANDLKSHYSGFSYVTDRGLKIIGLNSNTYYSSNLWSYLDITTDPDPFGQWKFLIDELIESEKRNQRVWIMAHVPTNSGDETHVPALIFKKIVERFAPYTISSIFYGHTHVDQFSVFYIDSPGRNSTINNSTNSIDKDPIALSWVVQSLTPWVYYNPSYRYYEVEDESFNIMESYNYYIHLNETMINNGDEPEWLLEYSAREAYDPDGTWGKNLPLNATFWDEYVVQKLKDKSNIEFNQLYMDYMYRKSPATPNCNGNNSQITNECWENNYCFVNMDGC
ncbi:unnamed protein product [Candida verbasci]|uniref:Calcineurin-like phosphoesterase domain-containing protein n=1 Tax=Candida verbasci TaxID=1227364 RepID=A0A9W4XEX1_9ASCO|nr:unnamed protein product [Candida verbasci]